MSGKLAAIGIIVKEMNPALAFYRLLGLHIEDSAEDHVGITLPNGISLMWDTEELIRSFDAEWTAPTGSHRVGLGFEFDNPAAVDAKYAEIVGAGHTGHKAPWDAFWGQRYAQVADPSGNVIDLYANLA